MRTKMKKRFELKKEKIAPLSSTEMKSIVGSGNANIHTIPPELFEAMFVNPARMK